MRTPFPFVNRIVEQYREWLTPRGRYLFWMTATLALIGLHTKGNQVFKIFAVSAAILAIASIFAILRPPAVELACRLPIRATAGRALTIPVSLETKGRSSLRPLFVSFPRPKRWGSSVVVEPRQLVSSAGSESSTASNVTLLQKYYPT